MPHSTSTNRDIDRVLIVTGAFGAQYEPAWARALNELGVKCELFNSHQYTLPGLLGRVERRLLCGPGIYRLRSRLIEKVKLFKPDAMVLYQGHYFDEGTIEAIKEYAFVVGYHNDDPFGVNSGLLRYRHLHKAWSSYDGYHFYRGVNVSEGKDRGVKQAGVLYSYFIPWLDYPRSYDEIDLAKWGSDLVFAGHVENDLRIECLARACRCRLNVRIFGETARWQRALPSDVRSTLPPIAPVFGEDYRLALCGAKIASCFFSKVNRDEYTRRVFEIPACGVFMLAERTQLMQEMFVEGREVELFSTPEEFIDKVQFYLHHDRSRQAIADKGRERVINGGNDVYARMRQWLEDVRGWKDASS